MVKQGDLKQLEVRYKTYRCYTFRVQLFGAFEAPLDLRPNMENVTRTNHC